MSSRLVEERFETPDVKSEWEPCTRVNVRYLSEAEIKAWVREANKRAKREQEYVKFRSVADDSGDNW